MRKRLPGLHDKSPDAFRRISHQKVHGRGVVSFRVDNVRVDNVRVDKAISRENGGSFPCNGWEELYIAYNASASECFLELRDNSEGAWEILADGQETDCRKPLPERLDGRVRVEAHSGLLLGRKARAKARREVKV